MTIDDISFEDFQAFIRVRDGGRFNMMTQCGGAAAAEGIPVDKHIAIIMNFAALTRKYGARLEKPVPAKKPRRRKGAASFEPDETLPNCGFARRAFVVQSRIPAIEKYRNWKTRSGDLSMKAALQFIEDQKRLRTLSNGPKHRYRIVMKTVDAAVVHED